MTSSLYFFFFFFLLCGLGILFCSTLHFEHGVKIRVQIIFFKRSGIVSRGKELLVFFFFLPQECLRKKNATKVPKGGSSPSSRAYFGNDNPDQAMSGKKSATDRAARCRMTGLEH